MLYTLLKQSINADARGHIVKVQYIGHSGDLSVQSIVGLVSKVGQPLYIALVRLPPRVVVSNFPEVGAADDGWNVIQDGPQERMGGVGIPTGVVLVQLRDQPREFG